MALSVTVFLLLIGLIPFVLAHRAHRRESFFAALEEQVRREQEHPVDYRGDQRMRAIQQRLSRKFGKSAFSEKTRKRILKQVEAHEVLGPWHRS